MTRHIVPAGEPIRIELVDRPTARRAPLVATGRLQGVHEIRPPPEPPEIALYDLGTLYRETLRQTGPGEWDTQAAYAEISHEQSVLFTPFEMAQLRDALVNSLQVIHVAESGREAWSTLRFPAGSTETDGTVTGLRFKRSDIDAAPVQVSTPISETAEWTRRVPIATRLADMDARIAAEPLDSIGRQHLIAARAEKALELNEPWDHITATRVGREGTLRPRLLDGRYTMGVSSGRHFQPWDAWDTATFKTTAVPNFFAEASSVPSFGVGRTECSQVDVFMASQLHQFTLQWVAIYQIGTIFFGSEVHIPQTVTYMNRLPFYPYPYSLSTGPSSAFLSFNDVAVSYQAERTQSYHAGLAADRALEVFSAWFYIILVGRISGRWLLTQREIRARTLCAVVGLRAQRGPYAWRYVWRLADFNRPIIPLDFGYLYTADVIPASILDSQLFDEGGSIHPPQGL